jgi:regulator of RNase E activity RraB
MGNSKETIRPAESANEKQLRILRIIFNGYKNKGLDPNAIIEMDGRISQADLELREKGTISADTAGLMDAMINKYHK